MPTAAMAATETFASWQQAEAVEALAAVERLTAAAAAAFAASHRRQQREEQLLEWKRPRGAAAAALAIHLLIGAVQRLR